MYGGKVAWKTSFYGIPAGEESDGDSDRFSFDDEFSNNSDEEQWVQPCKPERPRYPGFRSQLVYLQLIPDEFIAPAPFPVTFLRRLKTACEDGDVELVLACLKQKPDAVNAKLQGSLTPLMTAAIYGRLRVSKLLLSSKALIHARSEIYGTVIHCCIGGFADVATKVALIDTLLEAGADIEARDASGRTPYLFAADIGDLDLLKYLRAKGADVKTTGFKRMDAFLTACAQGHEEIMKYLHDEGLVSKGKDEVENYIKTAEKDGFLHVVKKFVDVDGFVSDVDGNELNKTARGGCDSVHEEVRKILRESCPSGDLEVGDPLVEHRLGRTSRVVFGLRDVLLGLDQDVGCDRLLLESKLKQAGLTRHCDLFSLTEELMEKIGISKVGDRMALMDLPFLALKTPFDFQEIRLDDGVPSENEEKLFKQLWLSRRHGNRKDLEHYLRLVLEHYRDSWDLVQAEAAFQNLSVIVSIMAAHFKVLTAYGMDEMRVIPFENDVKERTKLLIEAFAFALVEAKRMKKKVVAIRRAIEAEIRNNPCISMAFEGQSIEGAGFVSKAIRATGSVVNPRTPFIRFCDCSFGPLVSFALAYGIVKFHRHFLQIFKVAALSRFFPVL